MPTTAPVKRVHVTSVKDTPERSVRDFLQFRPAPFSPPPAPTWTSGAGLASDYISYVKAYKYYLSELAAIRKDFVGVFVEGGEYSQVDLATAMPPPPIPENTIYSNARSEQPALRAINSYLAAAQPVRSGSVFPSVIVTPRPARTPEEVAAQAEKQKVRRRNAKARRVARQKVAKQAQALTSLVSKTTEVKAKVQLARAEAGWVTVQSRAEKREARKVKRAGLLPTQQPPRISPPPEGPARPNRAERRRAMYGPPAMV